MGGGAMDFVMVSGAVAAACLFALFEPSQTNASRRWTFRHTTRTPAELGMWSPAGSWRVEPFADGTGGRALVTQGGVLLAESEPVRNARVGTRCRAETGTCGVVLGWAEGAYVAVAVDAERGLAVVARTAADGVREELATARVRPSAGWRQVVGEVRGERLQAHVDDDEVLDVPLTVRPGLVGLFADGDARYDELTTAARPRRVDARAYLRAD